MDDWRLDHAELDTGAELNVMKWRTTPVEKATSIEKEAGAMEYAAAGRWHGGEEGWRAAVLERGEREDSG